MHKHARQWVALAALTIAASSGFAQDFPSRPVKIIVPQTPGGASDALARIVAQKLEQWDGRSHPKRHRNVPKWKCLPTT